MIVKKKTQKKIQNDDYFCWLLCVTIIYRTYIITRLYHNVYCMDWVDREMRKSRIYYNLVLKVKIEYSYIVAEAVSSATFGFFISCGFL